MMEKLPKKDYIDLENLMQHVPHPDSTYTATGWHYELMALLGRFGYRPVGRYAAYELAVQLLEMGYDET